MLKSMYYSCEVMCDNCRKKSTIVKIPKTVKVRSFLADTMCKFCDCPIVKPTKLSFRNWKSEPVDKDEEEDGNGK